MNAGRLNRKVALQSLGTAQDAFGQLVQTWTTTATVSAEILPKTGRELMLAKSLQSEVAITITIRYRTGITAGMRATCGGVIYNIAAVIDIDGARKFLALECTTGVNNG